MSAAQAFGSELAAIAEEEEEQTICRKVSELEGAGISVEVWRLIKKV